MLWRPCASFPAYEVSEFGDVRRVNGKARKSAPNSAGYACFGLYRDGKAKTVQASHLVMEAFGPPKPFDGAQVCHNDGTRSNDHYSNLRWDSPKGNAADRRIHGTETNGERNGQSKLTVDDVIEIRKLSDSGATQPALSEKFGVAQGVISGIVNRKNWAHVA